LPPVWDEVIVGTKIAPDLDLVEPEIWENERID